MSHDTVCLIWEATLVNESDFSEVLGNLKKVNTFDAPSFYTLKEDTSELVALKILSRFLGTLTESLNEATAGLEKENPEEIWRACHKSAGSAELLGFKSYAKNCRSLISILKSTPQIDLYNPDIQNYLDETRHLLESIRMAFPQFKNYL